MPKSEQIFATAVVAALVAVGCARSAASGPEPAGPALAKTSGASEAAGQAAAGEPAAQPGPGPAPGVHPELPAAPWSGDRLAAAEAPSTLLEAWRQAANRDWCAPIAPSRLGEGEGASARMSELHGGWSVEFDKRGAPGMRADGRPCEDCGRATFGIAGTAMAPEELVAVEQGDAPPPSFADGSHAEVTAEAGVAAATITVSGQECVYQVWSYLGEDHVQQLMDDLRIVAVGDEPQGGRMAAGPSF